jgi:hypothetical protein
MRVCPDGDSHLKSQRSYARTEGDGLDRPSLSGRSDQRIDVHDDPQTGALLQGLNLKSSWVYVLPRNFAVAKSPDDFVFEQTTTTIQKLGRQVGVVVAVPGTGSYRSIHEKDVQIIAPVLVFAHQFLIEGGATLLVKLLEHVGAHVINNWGAHDVSDRDAVLQAIVTDGEKAKWITYRGPVGGLHSIVSIAESVFKDE